MIAARQAPTLVIGRSTALDQRVVWWCPSCGAFRVLPPAIRPDGHVHADCDVMAWPAGVHYAPMVECHAPHVLAAFACGGERAVHELSDRGLAADYRALVLGVGR